MNVKKDETMKQKVFAGPRHAEKSRETHPATVVGLSWVIISCQRLTGDFPGSIFLAVGRRRPILGHYSSPTADGGV
jgi:hypothetical protein